MSSPAFYPNQLCCIWNIAGSKTTDDFVDKLDKWVPQTDDRMVNLLQFIGVKEEDLHINDWCVIGQKYQHAFSGKVNDYKFKINQNKTKNLCDYLIWKNLPPDNYYIRTDTNTLITECVNDRDKYIEIDPMAKTVEVLENKDDSIETIYSFLYSSYDDDCCVPTKRTGDSDEPMKAWWN